MTDDTGELLAACARSVVEGDERTAVGLARRVVEEKLPAIRAIEEGFAAGIREVGRLWEEGVYFLPELVVGAKAMKAAMRELEPALEGSGPSRTSGRVVIGTVRGDIHDIGKTLVATMLSANGFSVIDLGADVPAARFVDEAEASGAACVAVSSLLTTTMAGQREVAEELERRSLRGAVKLLVGGAPVTEAWALEIGADGYAGDAVAAVALAKRVIGGEA